MALAAAAVWFRLWEPFPHISVIGIAATLIGGYPIFKEAFENIVERKMTMELSMTIALLSALAIGEFFTALVITAFVLAAEVLEGLTVGRGRRAIQDLLDFLPRTVSVRRNNEVVEIPAENLQLGEAVIVKPGGRIPVDGLVLSGRSFRGAGSHHRRSNAGREIAWKCGLRRNHQSIGSLGNQSR